MAISAHIEEIPYHPDSGELFNRIRDMPGAALLDSSHPYSRLGRFDILVAGPLDAAVPELAEAASEQQTRHFFGELRAVHCEYFEAVQPVAQDIPFCGGILGHLSYDLGNCLHGVAAQPTHAPLHSLHVYDWCLLQDHLLRRAMFVSLPRTSAAVKADVMARVRTRFESKRRAFALQAGFAASMSEREYRSAFESVQAYIQAGDCYQVNLAQHFCAQYEGNTWSAYRELRKAAAAPFSAYLSLPEGGALMSLSPERFLTLHGHRVETSPIKGTRPRYEDSAADEMAAAELRASAKDRAENLMIVDLLRNDLGRSCVPGSIHVDRLFELQSFPTVHHLVSTISGELQADRTAWELLRDSFPGGSITGAPKRRAMEIIGQLENYPRRPYCGSVLYISADGHFDSNIAIRTLLCEDNNIHCWAGGGIVADSQWQSEYQETFDKVGRLLALLETMTKD